VWVDISPNSQKALQTTLAHWRASGRCDAWVFAYASLIWRPEFEFVERRRASVQGFRRALEMKSTINRGTPECPGLVFAMMPEPGAVCEGVVFRIAAEQFEYSLHKLWIREMPNAVYDVPWLPCATAQGQVSAMAFTLPLESPSYCGKLTEAQYRQIFSQACGRYGSTLDYARLTYQGLQAEGIEDAQLAQLLTLAGQ
jgi:glutathione-specific gamma-glutamylcyclotransferase